MNKKAELKKVLITYNILELHFNQKIFLGFHEDIDRRISQNSLGDVTKLGSKTALNRRVRNWQS